MEPTIISSERHGLKRGSIAGKSSQVLCLKVAQWLEELHGHQVFVNLVELDGTQTLDGLAAWLREADDK